ncbi:MAG: winged helix-turn-helix domain-containing protein [Deltaproteobacteria bacterium]|jgi:transposase|nr:winged helix-turn-helix domain-containing protein [Deltaproteobacteria bacterium]
MARTVKFSQGHLEKAIELRDKHSIDREQRAALIVLCMANTGCSRENAAAIFGIDIRTVHEDLERIRNNDAPVRGQWGGGNNHLMTFDEEAKFLNNYLDEAKAGHVITMPELHNKYNELVGKITPASTFYRLLKRHKWRKVLPDTQHPKADPALQEDFKKKLLKMRWIRLS